MSEQPLQPIVTAGDAPTLTPASRPVRRISIPACCFLAGALVLALRVAMTVVPLWTLRADFPDQVLDDAYMYTRYADHVLKGDGIRWNAGDPPTFGTTSLGYLAWVTIVRALTPGDPFRSIVLASMIPGLLVPFALILLAAGRILPTMASPWALAFGGLLVLQRPLIDHIILIHAFTGMETTFSILGLAGILLIHHKAWQRMSVLPMILESLTPALAFLVRPDLLPFPVSVLLLSAWTQRDVDQRRRAMRTLGGALIALAILTATCWCYFGTPVPLSFFAKSGGIYGASMRAAYSAAATDDLHTFVQRYALLFIPATVYAGYLVRHARHRPAPMDLGVLSGCVIFMVYHLEFVVPIMHYYERFYTPMLPAVAWLAFRAVESLAEGWSRQWTAASRTRVARWGLCAAAIGTCWASLPIRWVQSILPERLAPEGLNLADSLRLMIHDRPENERPRFSVLRNYQNKWRNYWYRLDEISALPDDLVIATTEIGHVAALNPNKRIIDLSGLNDARFIFHGWDMEAMLRVDRPDVIYLPHPDYISIGDALRTCSRFREEYDVFDPDVLGGTRFGIALRRTSPHARILHDLIRRP